MTGVSTRNNEAGPSRRDHADARRGEAGSRRDKAGSRRDKAGARRGEAGTGRGEAVTRRRRADGERSRRAILEGATRLATVEGLEGLSIGHLAEHIGMSKSGLYAHFGSKEDLQLATIETAEEIFSRQVTGPGLAQPEGVAQILGLTEAFMSYLERRTFPGGCFFAAASVELAMRDGRVKDRIRGFVAEWMGQLADVVRTAQRRGELDESIEPEQLAFEIDSLLLGANTAFVLFDDDAALARGLAAVRSRLNATARADRDIASGA
jgi:AcrR family transcriptional regulator